MIDNLKWLLRNEEIEFEKKKFRGKLAGKAHKYSTNIDGLVRTRVLIFIAAAIVLYRVLGNYLFHDVFDLQFLIERVVFAVVILSGGLLFNKFRVISIILAVLPLILITGTYIFVPGQFHLRTIVFMIALILIIIVGIYYNFQMKRIKAELEVTLIENQLIDDEI